MANRHGIVSARALGDAEISQLKYGFPPPLEPVGNNQSVRVHPADGRHDAPDDAGINIGRQLRRFVNQIETQLPGRDVAVAARELGPLEIELFLGLLVLPEI